eukprot:snap_masked-scaffold_8-processed-gene-8.16-mRNA-1 protein AED:1.00 eAED:1.00 QI:0/0/0/0/1/1/2/0/81
MQKNSSWICSMFTIHEMILSPTITRKIFLQSRSKLSEKVCEQYLQSDVSRKSVPYFSNTLRERNLVLLRNCEKLILFASIK